jgi:hypothetical protein
VVDILDGRVVGLEVDVEGEALVFGVVLMGVFVAEESFGGVEFGDFGAAGAKELENGVGFDFSIFVAVGVEADGGFVSGVDLSSPPAPRGGVLLGG